MQFQVPQFIEVEDKIFGPLTFKQFIYIAGSLGTSYILWRELPFILATPLIAGIVGFGVALAFFEWNGRPFIVAIEHGFFYILHPKLYLWNNQKKAEVRHAEVEAPPSQEIYVPKLSESRLHELAWSLDIKEKIQQGMDESAATPFDPMERLRTARDARVA